MLVDTEFTNLKQLQQAFVTKIKASDLTEKDAKLLKFQPLMAVQVARLAGLPVVRAGFKIPYFDIDGKTTKFYRIRYLEYANKTGWAAVAIQKPLRYGQPADTLNEVYLPPTIKWRELAPKVDIPIVITEGELKAACGCKHQLPVMGLGGVWNFRSAAAHLPILPMFTQFEWRERRAYICYDSDAATNAQVTIAENALARELTALGAIPFICRIPAGPEGEKQGIDDYIAAHSVVLFVNDVLEKAEEWKKAQELFKLNEEVVYIKDPGVILVLENLQRITAQAFTQHAFSTRVYYEEQANGKGTKLVEKSAAKEWLKWPHRSVVASVTYQPGATRTTPDGKLNLWRGWGCQPVRGNVEPWERLLAHLFTGSKPEERQWFERWLAYPLQHPGTKLFSAAVLWSRIHGVGKSLVGYTMFKIYGDNATEIGDRELYSAYNEWAEHRQFVMGDEITSGENKRDSCDRMKSMITQPRLRLNPKYVPAYTIDDCINYYFTSNHPDSFFLDDNDRRFFIYEVKAPKKDNEFYRRYADWLNNSGPAHLFEHLLTLPMGDFNPNAEALSTESKEDMIDVSRSDLAAWCNRLHEDPDSVLLAAGIVVPYQLFTTTELLRHYDSEGKTRVTANGLARELRRAGFRKVYNGAPVLTETAGRQRLWAIRNIDKLLNVFDHPRLVRQYEEERAKIKAMPKGLQNKKKY